MPPQVAPDFEQITAVQKQFTQEVRRLQKEMAALDPTDLEGRQRIQDEMTALQQDLQKRMQRLQMGARP